MDDLVLFQLFGFLPVSVISVLDLLVVTLVVYRLLNLIRGMRAAQMLAGLFLLATVALAARWLEMAALAPFPAKTSFPPLSFVSTIRSRNAASSAVTSVLNNDSR